MQLKVLGWWGEGGRQDSLPFPSGRAPGRTLQKAMPEGVWALMRTRSELTKQHSLMLMGTKGYFITSGADWLETSRSHKTSLKSLCLEIGKGREFIIIVLQSHKKGESQNE